MTENKKVYSADTITVLEGLEAVRMRPAMYIGDIGTRGLHHLINEVVDNSIDEALGGYCDKISVTITPDGGISVEDNGRGIPVDMHKKEKKPAVEVVMTVLHAGGKFNKDNYKVSGGLHGVGVSCVNALSSKMVTQVFKKGKIYRIEFARGKTVKQLEVIGDTDKIGTKQIFYPDHEIFEITEFNFEVVSSRLRVLSFLNKGVRIVVTDERESQKDENGNFPSFDFYSTGGLKEFVEYIDENRRNICSIISIDKEKGVYPVEIALSWNDSYRENIESYVNNIHTVEGGTHEEGFKSGLTRSINNYITKNNKTYKNLKLSGSDVREGLTAVLSLKVMEPQFEGQTKTKLGNNDVTGVVQSVIYEALNEYFEENPKEIKAIIDKCTEALRAREAARKAKDLIRRKTAFEGGSMPNKLYDCSKGARAEDCELFLVEGDSAGGSAVDGRDIKTQAILPMRGKILNVEKSRLDKMLANEEIKNLITAIGTGIGEGEDGFNPAKLRYGKIIIMTDADVDGLHIATLFLTFFFRYMPQLIANGNIYIALPPIYRVSKGKNHIYILPAPDQEEKKAEAVKQLGGDENSRVTVQRYKGLGEMNPDQLKETTLDANNRVIKRIYVDDAVEADRIFTMLMGVEVPNRREFIIDRCKFAQNIDI